MFKIRKFNFTAVRLKLDGIFVEKSKLGKIFYI